MATPPPNQNTGHFAFPNVSDTFGSCFLEFRDYVYYYIVGVGWHFQQCGRLFPGITGVRYAWHYTYVYGAG